MIRGVFMNENFSETMKFEAPKENPVEPKEVLFSVYTSLIEKGYNPIDQIIGYLLSGDPTYITSHNNARSLIRKLERDELLEEILRAYLKCGKV
jgi:uncharacterized protein (UPF0297 family)